MALEVIGAGLGRTGTNSLAVALEQLGVGRCYRWSVLQRRPRDIRRWLDIVRGGPADWDQLYAGFKATVDWPGCLFYRELAAHYPQAKVILSVRDPEAWYASARRTIYRAIEETPRWAVRLAPGAVRRYAELIETAVWQGTFEGRFADKAAAIAAFERHNAAVIASIPPERLLVFDVREGWEPLCRFLGVPVPDRPFPRLNDGASFERTITRWVWAGRLAGAAVGVGAAVGLAALLGAGQRWRYQRRATNQANAARQPPRMASTARKVTM